MSMSPLVVTYGWTGDASITSLVRSKSPVFEAVEFVVIRTVDSSNEPWEMPWLQRRLDEEPDWALSARPLVVSGRQLVSLVRAGDVFFGFDEIWLLSNKPMTQPPEDCYLEAPLKLDEDPLPTGVAAWIEAEGVRVGLGDGFGLNFAGSDFELIAEFGLANEARRAGWEG